MPGAPWPRAVLGLLAVLVPALALLRLAHPPGAAVLAAVLLTAGCVTAAAAVARAASAQPGVTARPWRAVALALLLLAPTHVLSALDASGALGRWGALADVPPLLAVPVALCAWARLLPPRPRRLPGPRVVIDGVVVLLSTALLGEIALGSGPSPAALERIAWAGAVPVAVWPVLGALMCGAGLVVVTVLPPGRRRAAGWLLVACVAVCAAAVGTVVGVADPGSVVGVLTDEAWVVFLAAAAHAVTLDRDAAAPPAEEAEPLPLLGIVVSHLAAYGVTLVLVLGIVAGRPVRPGEGLVGFLLVVLTFVRSMLWAADGRRLTRRLQQTEAYFRALVHSAEDVTAVLDGDGRVSWVSGAVQAQLGWTARELTGRVLAGLVEPEHRDVVAGLSSRDSAAGEAPVTVRLRTADGGRRDVEISGVARAGLPDSPGRDGLVLHLRDVTTRRSTQRELERMAFTDYLTGLPNRARFMAALDEARDRSAAGHPACVLLLDLDGFKAVNDVAGHDAGDRLLCEVAEALRQGARDGDLVARLGGDEFALVVDGGLAEATGLAERLVAALDRPFRFAGNGEGGPVFGVSGSIGVAELLGHDDAVGVVRRADLALRAAKADGKACVRSSGQALDNAMARRARLARDLPAALDEGQLELRYQPVVGVHQRRVLGVEALVRWEHPLLGTVPPDEFIDLAEDDGLIVPLQRWVLRTATAELAALVERGHDLRLGVNISVRHLQAGCLVPDVAAALSATGLDPARLMLEITESILVDAEGRLEGDLTTLADMGCVISLDDFGRGYSSLAYLARLPVHVLKMDREFVADIETDRRSAALVGTVVELGRTLGIDVVAEGVETAGQLAVLQELDCRFLQGYLLGRPVAAAELPAVLDGFDPSVLDAGRPVPARG